MLKRITKGLASAEVETYLSDVKVPLAKKLQSFETFKSKLECMALSTIELDRILELENG